MKKGLSVDTSKTIGEYIEANKNNNIFIFFIDIQSKVLDLNIINNMLLYSETYNKFIDTYKNHLIHKPFLRLDVEKENSFYISRLLNTVYKKKMETNFLELISNILEKEKDDKQSVVTYMPYNYENTLNDFYKDALKLLTNRYQVYVFKNEDTINNKKEQ